jgi:chemotaxis protein methyltransferase CheR
LVRTLVYGRSGIVLEDKAYLIESRLSSLAHRDGFGDLTRLLTALRGANAAALEYRVVEALTTNETLFFRDVHPFETLKQTILPELLAHHASDKRLRIWSAACSTGQEPYSLAMLLNELIPHIDAWKIDIFGTDLSKEAIGKARAGIYSQVEINRGLPPDKLLKYFEQAPGGWLLNRQIRQMAKFDQMNLMDRWPVRHPFDLILLRNVMIYFDNPLRKAILAKIAGQLAPGGYFLMGTGESPVALSDRFEVRNIGRTAVYHLKAS